MILPLSVLLTLIHLTSATNQVHQIRAITASDSTRYVQADGSPNLVTITNSILSAQDKYVKVPNLSGDGKQASMNLRRKRGVSVTVPLMDEFASNQRTGTSQSNDIGYYGFIGMGTPKQSLSFFVDTGSSDLWIAGTNCVGCSGAGTFDSTASSTYTSTGQRSQITYGSAQVAGVVALDTVNPGLEITNQQFLVIDRASGFTNDEAAGLLGMAFSILATNNAKTMMENLISSRLLAQNIFSLYFERNVKTGSTLTLGGVDASHYTGTFAYTPVIEYAYWTVNATGMSVNGVKVTQSFGAAIDSGTSLTYLPRSVAKAVFDSIPGAFRAADYSSSTTDLYLYPCSTTAVIALSFDGSANQYSIDAGDLNLGEVDATHCLAALIGMDSQSPYGSSVAIIGDTFLKSWTSSFNYGVNPPFSGSSVGFAAANGQTVGCPVTYTRDSTNNCVPITSAASLAQKASAPAPLAVVPAVVTCSDGTTLDGPSNTCVCLSPRFTDANGICQPACSNSFTLNAAGNACTCASPQFVDGTGACHAPCTNSFVLDASSKSCSCPAPSYVDVNGVCSPACIHGLSLNAAKNACVCASNSVITSNGLCSPCLKGFTANRNKTACICVFPNFVVNRTCRSLCPAGLVLNAQKTKCVPAPASS